MSKDGFTEKRAFTRFPVSIRVRFPDPAQTGEVIHADTNDICAAGIGIVTEKKLLPGIELDIYLHMDDTGEEIRLKGKVAWTIAADSGKYRVGIKLDTPSLKPIPLVLRILNSRY